MSECKYAVILNESVNSCKLGYYGGKPSKGVCRTCVELGKNKPQNNFLNQAASLGKALVNWTDSGFTATPPDILSAREATCRECPEWDSAALNNTGRCRKCGCSTWAKLRMATERCPIGKWEALPPAP